MIAVSLWLIFLRIIEWRRISNGGKDDIWKWLISEAKTTDRTSIKVSTFLFVLCAVVLGYAAVAQSSVLFIPSMMLLIASWIISRIGIAGFKFVAPAWLLLLLTVPFPFSLDLTLVNRMQFLASGLASWILDSLGQIHFLEGLTLVTAKKQFFTEEACSGIRSLFSSIAAISAYGVLLRYPTWRHVFNWFQVVLWVLVGNAVRIAIVVYVSDNYTEAIGSGGWHQLLGIAVFGLILLLALSTNRAFDVFWPEELIGDSLLAPETVEGTVESRANAAVNEVPSQEGWIRWVAVAFFGLLFLFGIRLVYAQQIYEPFSFDARDLIEVQAGALPGEIDGWKVVGFDEKIRPVDSTMAPSSFLWELQKGSKKCTISLDGPYQEYHDLCVCYRGIGWSLGADYEVATKDPSRPWATLTKLKMRKRGQHGLVLFSAFDSKGQPIISNRSLLSREGGIMRNLKMVFGVYQPQVEQPAELPISQIQLLVERQGEISESEVEELMQLYYRASDLLLNSKRFAKAQ